MSSLIQKNTSEMSREEFNRAFYGDDSLPKNAQNGPCKKSPILQKICTGLAGKLNQDSPFYLGFLLEIQTQAGSGLYYFRARYYDAELGRFISRDPLGYVDGLNLYRGYFVPLGVDPSGMEVVVNWNSSLQYVDQDDSCCETLQWQYVLNNQTEEECINSCYSASTPPLPVNLGVSGAGLLSNSYGWSSIATLGSWWSAGMLVYLPSVYANCVSECKSLSCTSEREPEQGSSPILGGYLGCYSTWYCAQTNRPAGATAANYFPNPSLTSPFGGI